MKQSQKDPLGPIAFVVSALLGVLVMSVIVLIPLTVWGDGSIAGMGDDFVCATSRNPSWDFDDAGTYIDRLPREVTVGTDRIRICRDHAPSRAQWLETAWLLVPMAYFIGFLVLAWLIVRRGYRQGLFVQSVSRQVGVLGWYLLAGSLLAMVAEAVLKQQLLQTLVPGLGGSWFDGATFPWAEVIAGFCVLTVGRVMAHAVRMQHEVDTLV